MNYEVIREVYETGNLSKTAKKFNYSQSAVSQMVQSFEKSMGLTLFERSKTGVKPLPGFKPLFDSLKIIVEEEKRMKEYVESVRELDKGVVRLGCLTRVATKWMPDIFKQFEAEYPNIHYEMTAGSFYDLRNNLKQESVDFAFVSGFAAKGFGFTPIVKDELVVLLPKGHPLAEKDAVDVEALNYENIIITSEGFDFEIGDALKSIREIEKKAKYRFNDDIVCIKFVELGFGVCVLPRLFLDVVGTKFDVEIRSFQKKYYRTLGIAYPNREYMSPVATKFVSYMRTWFKKHADEIENVVV